jgi:hypothetical protein
MARTEGDIAGAAAELIDAFNEADWSRLRPLLASDLVYDETGTGRRVEGADAYVALLDGWKAAFPDAPMARATAPAVSKTPTPEI